MKTNKIIRKIIPNETIQELQSLGLTESEVLHAIKSGMRLSNNMLIAISISVQRLSESDLRNIGLTDVDLNELKNDINERNRY